MTLQLVPNPAAPTWVVLYEYARRHGLGHRAALEAANAGEVRCWCGRSPGCVGGAQRLVGCPVLDVGQFEA